MERRRIPSTSSSIGRAGGANIRHRSGAFSPRPRADSGSAQGLSQQRTQTERTDRTLTVQVEDADDADAAPTVLLVRHSRARYADLKPLPDVPQAGGHNSSDHFVLRHGDPATPSAGRSAPARTQGSEDETHRELSSVALTPRLTPEHERLGVHSAHSSRLPTPSYPTEHGHGHEYGGGGLRLRRQLTSYFARVPSLLALPRPAPGARADSAASAYSHASDGSTSTAVSRTPSRARLVPAPRAHHEVPIPTALKDKRPLLVSAFSTTDKFTRKFPRPRGLGTGAAGAASAAALLEEGAGLGVERVGRWTAHKWCLVLSVCTVFVYGAAGLVCAVLTWFRGVSSPPSRVITSTEY